MFKFALGKACEAIATVVDGVVGFVCDRAIGNVDTAVADTIAITNGDLFNKMFRLGTWIDIAIMLLVTFRTALGVWFITRGCVAAQWDNTSKTTIKDYFHKYAGLYAGHEAFS